MARPPESFPEDVRETFEFCEECESLVVRLDAHTCSTGPSPARPSPAEREELAAADDRPPDEDVLYPRGRSQNNAWAYHELDEDGEVRCGNDHAAGSVIGPRREAVEAGCYPCGRCRTLEDCEE